MKTILLILSALCGLASTAMAQIYSQNVVGYVNVVCKPGFNLIGNPLVAATNKLSVVIPNPPDSTMIYEYVGGRFQIATYYTGDGWDNDLDFYPGTGAWINNPTSTNLTLTFVGEVAQGVLTNQVPVGISLKSSMVPQAGPLDTLLNYTPSEFDLVYFYRNGVFQITGYYPPDGWDFEPWVNVGEAFWLYTSAPKSWIRTFNPNE